MAAKFSGGYSVKVIHQNDNERFKCMLCHDIIKLATHGCINHVFCKECMEEYIKNNRNKVQLFCPAGCRIPFDKNSLHRSKIIDRYINKIACECPDCSWKGDLYDFVQHHERNCVEKKISCHLCSEFIKRKDLKSHASYSCSKRKVMCMYCKDPILHNEYVVHKEVCGDTKVNCSYQRVGCGEMIERKSLNIHYEKNTKKHLELSTRYFEEKIKSLEIENANLAKCVANAKNHLSSISLRVLKPLLSKESIKKHLDKPKNILSIFESLTTFEELKRCFKEQNFSVLADHLIKVCNELADYSYELEDLISTSDMVYFGGVNKAFFFKTEKLFGVISFSGGTSLEQVNGKYWVSLKNSKKSYVLSLNTWDIEVTENPIDVLKKDKRFKLSSEPIGSSYGCFWERIVEKG